MKARPSPRQMKVRAVVGAVTRPTGRREYVHVGTTVAIPAADACRSSNRTLLGTGIIFHIEKLDKESESTNFHSNGLTKIQILQLQVPE